MRASIIAVIFAISLITAVIAFSWHKSGAVRAFLFQLALVATLISGFLSVGFEAYSKKVYTSSRLETSRTLKLVAIKNTSYYLVRNGEEYYYKYIDENGNVSMKGRYSDEASIPCYRLADEILKDTKKI